ncbi:MAG: histidine phosphatase family protein [Chloroflexia bacterium]|nr:histidine phosphatase family protein [Chloroflexia bacterium]
MPPESTTTTICLVRHGETDWNRNNRYQGWADTPLNATGLAQAKLVAQVIAGESWDAIVSSPLARAFQTAQAIADASPELGHIEQDPDLRERGYGEAEGLTLAEREARWEGPDWPGLEPWEVMAQRANAALERIARRHAGKRVLVVSHGGLMNAVLTSISGGDVGSGITVILNTARTTLLHDASDWTIETVTDVSHLEMAVR